MQSVMQIKQYNWRMCVCVCASTPNETIDLIRFKTRDKLNGHGDDDDDDDEAMSVQCKLGSVHSISRTIWQFSPIVSNRIMYESNVYLSHTIRWQMASHPMDVREVMCLQIEI